jgi:predicted nucleic acid-binding protein
MDASLAIDVLLGEPARQARAIRFLSVCMARGVALIVPPTFPSEADTAVRRNVKRSQLTPAQMAATFAALDKLPLDIALDATELNIVRQRARQIAEELALMPVYDATYAALAEARGCDFWTADEKFANAAKQVRRQPNGTTAPTLPNVRFIGDF